MATVDKARTEPFNDQVVFTWTPLANGDDGTPMKELRSGDRVVQVFGTFGASGTLILEGSLDGANWFQLRDPSSTLISFTAAGGKAILEAVPYVRPRVTNGDGTTALACLVSMRRN